MPEPTQKCRSHNPEVAGSNPARATRETAGSRAEGRLPGQREPPRLLPNFCPKWVDEAAFFPGRWARRIIRGEELDERYPLSAGTDPRRYLQRKTSGGELVWKHRRELAAAQPVDRRPKGVPHPLRGGGGGGPCPRRASDGRHLGCPRDHKRVRARPQAAIWENRSSGAQVGSSHPPLGSWFPASVGRCGRLQSVAKALRAGALYGHAKEQALGTGSTLVRPRCGYRRSPFSSDSCP